MVSNDIKQPKFRPILEVAYKNDPVGALFFIPPMVVMVQDVKRCYSYKIGAIGDMEIRDGYDRLCVNGFLKDVCKIFEMKDLTHALKFPTIFKIEWIRLLLSRINDGSLWLEDGLVKISKRIFHRVARYPTLDQPKTLRSDSKEIIENNTRAKWNKRGMNINIIHDPLINFVFRVISHNFYQSSRLNNIPYIVVGVGYKLVKNDHTYDLVELQLQQINENLGAIRRSKGAQCIFGAILVCIFFYV